MNTRLLLLTSTFVGSLLLGACGDLDAKSAHDAGKGTARVYDATTDQAWTAAHAAVTWNHVGAATDHADEHYFVTDPTHFDQIGVWLTAEGDKTRVSVVVIDDPNLPGPNEEDVQKDVAKAIDLVKAGKPTDKRP
jgi:hypothetical protein